jgi:hypothetical protein
MIAQLINMWEKGTYASLNLEWAHAQWTAFSLMRSWTLFSDLDLSALNLYDLHTTPSMSCIGRIIRGRKTASIIGCDSCKRRENWGEKTQLALKHWSLYSFACNPFTPRRSLPPSGSCSLCQRRLLLTSGSQDGSNLFVNRKISRLQY